MSILHCPDGYADAVTEWGRDNEKADLLTVYSLDYLTKSQYDPLKVADGIKITQADELKLRNFELWVTVRIPIKGFSPSESEAMRLDALFKDLLAKLKGLTLSPIIVTLICGYTALIKY